jgi:hypothetical protein
LSVLAIACVVVAGCGGGGDGTGANGSKPAARTTTTEAIQPLVETCKQQAAATEGVSDADKEEAYAACQKAASGDAQGVRETTRDVCVKLIEKAHTPDGPEKKQAQANCQAWVKP